MCPWQPCSALLWLCRAGDAPPPVPPQSPAHTQGVATSAAVVAALLEKQKAKPPPPHAWHRFSKGPVARVSRGGQAHTPGQDQGPAHLGRGRPALPCGCSVAAQRPRGHVEGLAGGGSASFCGPKGGLHFQRDAALAECLQAERRAPPEPRQSRAAGVRHGGSPGSGRLRRTPPASLSGHHPEAGLRRPGAWACGCAELLLPSPLLPGMLPAQEVQSPEQKRQAGAPVWGRPRGARLESPLSHKPPWATVDQPPPPALPTWQGGCEDRRRGGPPPSPPAPWAGAGHAGGEGRGRQS